MKPEPDFPQPSTVQSAPDKLKTFLEKYAEKSISFVLQRSPTRGVRKVLLWAKLESKDDATSLGDVVTARAQSDLEETGKDYPYRIELEVTGEGNAREPLKVDCRFKLLPQSDTQPEVSEEESETEATALDEMKYTLREVRYLVGDLRHMLNENHSDLRLQNETIASMGTAALSRDSESQARIHQLLEEGAQNRLKIRELEVEEKEIDQKTTMQRELMDLLKPAVEAGVEQYMGKKNQATIDSATKPSAEDSKPDQKKEDDPEHPLALAAEALWETLQSDQWFKIHEVLDRDQVQAFQKVCSAKTDEKTAELFQAFHADLSKIQFADLKAVLDRDQKGLIVQLYLAAKRIGRAVETQTEDSPALNPETEREKDPPAQD